VTRAFGGMHLDTDLVRAPAPPPTPPRPHQLHHRGHPRPAMTIASAPSNGAPFPRRLRHRPLRLATAPGTGPKVHADTRAHSLNAWRPPEPEPIVVITTTRGRWQTRTADLCRVKEDPRSVTASSIGSSRVAKGHESAGQAACRDRGSTAHDDPSEEAGGRFSRHFRAIAAPSIARKWRGAAVMAERYRGRSSASDRSRRAQHRSSGRLRRPVGRNLPR
jgi:hypothetical protein